MTFFAHKPAKAYSNKESFSKMHGVQHRLKHGKRVWVAHISIEGQKTYLGQHPTEYEAAKAYDRVASVLSNKPLNFRK
jgi:hypothetical protein